MKLSTRGRYGTRMMVDLAFHYGTGPILLKDIAERQEVSKKYLEHLISPLLAAGLVRSVRGARGGYILGREPAKINLAEIIQVLEGSMAPVNCVDDPGLCHRVKFCVTYEIWGKIKGAVTEVLSSVTLQDMVERQKSKEKSQTVKSR